MYTSIDFSTSIDSCKHPPNQFHPSKKTPHIATHPIPTQDPWQLPRFLVHHRGFFSLRLSYKWNRSVCNLLRMALSLRMMSLGLIQGAARVHIWSFLLPSSIPLFSCATVCLSIHPWLVFRVSWGAFVKGILVLSFLLWSVSCHSVQPACFLPLPSPALSVPFPFPLSSHWAKGHTCPGSETSQSRRARGRCGWGVGSCLPLCQCSPGPWGRRSGCGSPMLLLLSFWLSQLFCFNGGVEAASFVSLSAARTHSPPLGVWPFLLLLARVTFLYQLRHFICELKRTDQALLACSQVHLWLLCPLHFQRLSLFWCFPQSLWTRSDLSHHLEHKQIKNSS